MKSSKFFSVLAVVAISSMLAGCGPAMKDRIGTLKDVRSYPEVELNTESNLQFEPTDHVPTDCSTASTALGNLGDLEQVAKFSIKSSGTDIFLVNEYIYKAKSSDDAKAILAEVSAAPNDPCMNKEQRTTSSPGDISNLTDANVEGSFWTEQTVLELNLPAIHMYSKTTFNGLVFIARKDEYLVFADFGNEDASPVTKNDFYSIADTLLKKFGQ